MSDRKVERRKLHGGGHAVVGTPGQSNDPRFCRPSTALLFTTFSRMPRKSPQDTGNSGNGRNPVSNLCSIHHQINRLWLPMIINVLPKHAFLLTCLIFLKGILLERAICTIWGLRFLLKNHLQFNYTINEKILSIPKVCFGANFS